VGNARQLIVVTALLAFTLFNAILVSCSPPPAPPPPPTCNIIRDHNQINIACTNLYKESDTLITIADNNNDQVYRETIKSGYSGLLNQTIDISKFEPGNYTCTVKCLDINFLKSFTIDNIEVDPQTVALGTQTNIKITCFTLLPRKIVNIKIVLCRNDSCTDNRVVYVAEGENQFTNSDGELVVDVQSLPKWESGNYVVTVTDGLKTLTGNFAVIDPGVPTCRNPKFEQCHEIGCCVPNFNLKSLSGSGKWFDLYSELGTPIWINFWNTSCPGCMEYMSIIQDISKTWPPGKLKIFSLNCGEDPVVVNNFLRDRGYTFFLSSKEDINFPVLLDTNSLTKQVYHPGGDPAHYFIDRDGILRVKKFGYRSISTKEEVNAIVGQLQ
jgi:thiol-disulfide isomerase/thioredoxin